MKACLICGNCQDELAEVCPSCGEASWGPVDVVHDSFVPETMTVPEEPDSDEAATVIAELESAQKPKKRRARKASNES